MSPARTIANRRGLSVLMGLAVLGVAGVGLRAHFKSAPAAGVVSIATEHTYQDGALLAEAFELPVARTYRDVVSQPNGSLCGPTSVANVLRSLGTRGASPSDVLEGSGVCPLGFCMAGLTLEQLATLASAKTGRRARILRGLTLEAFRAELVRTNDPARRVIANFNREPLFGVSSGHHSPIAGYLAERDLVLVLDVNANYGPWLVSSERLYRAVRTIDSATGKERGLLVLE